MKMRKNRWQPRRSLPHRRSFHPSGMKLSLCMIVKNEAHNLADCIGPIKSAVEEIVVVDTGSTDQTREVARQLGAKVFNFLWGDDFSAARNESIRRAAGDYILWMDADDRIEPEEVKRIDRLKEGFPQEKNQAYSLIVSNPSLVDGETLFRQLRIFPRVKGAYFEGRIHEQIFHRLKPLGVKRIETDIRVRHQGYHSPEEVAQKSERNLTIIKKALASDPENLFLHYHAARTLAGINRFKEAMDHMKKVVEHPKVREKEKHFVFDASLLLAQWQMESYLYEDALRLLDGIEGEGESHRLVHFYRGDLFFRMGNDDGAIRETSAFLDGPFEAGMLPVNSDWIRHYPYHILWQCYLKKGEDTLAEEMFLKIMSQARATTKCLEELGLRCLKGGRFDAAAEYYQKAIEEGSPTDLNYANLGLARWKSGRPDDAKAAFEKSLELNPQRVESMANLGHLCRQEKDDQKAVDYFNRALCLRPDLADVRLAMSEIFFRAYDADRLVEQCDQLLKDLGLPRSIVIESLKDLSGLYEKISEALLGQGLGRLALMASSLSFLIQPSTGGMERFLQMAREQGKAESAIKQVKEALAFHGMSPLRETVPERPASSLAPDG